MNWHWILLGALLVLVIVVNVVDLCRLTTTIYQIPSRKIARDLRIVVLADLHNRRFGNHNRRLLKQIRECKPDFICVAGDMLTALPRDRNRNAYQLLEELAKEFTIYYGEGNHESRMRWNTKRYGLMGNEFVEFCNRVGIVRLDNETITLAEHHLAITGLSIGREYYQKGSLPCLSEDIIKATIRSVEAEYFQVLLAHNPEYFKDYQRWSPDLVVSGHLHGGIVRLPFMRGIISPRLRLFPRYASGYYKENAVAMIVSRGLGWHTLPLRFGNPGEVVVIDLCKENDHGNSGETRCV